MDAFLLIGLIILIFAGIPIGIGLLLYFTPKRLGCPKTAKYLTILYGIVVLAIGLFIEFKDQLFTMHQARELVEEQGFKLIYEFELIHNESTFDIGDYYHTFTLKISYRDKQEAISKIVTSENYKPVNCCIESLLYQQAKGRNFIKKIIQNYETENSYVREYFEPSGQEGYAPTFRRISISKTYNELIFEDIDE